MEGENRDTALIKVCDKATFVQHGCLTSARRIVEGRLKDGHRIQVNGVYADNVRRGDAMVYVVLSQKELQHLIGVVQEAGKKCAVKICALTLKCK